MTFLKKLGQILADVVAVALGIGPIIKPFLGSGKTGQLVTTELNDLTAMGQVVLQIETAIQAPKSGPQKLAAVIPLISNIVKTSELVFDKKIANDAMFTKAVEEYAQATVDLLNSIHPDEAKHA